MTKAEQRKILEQIDALIKSADADSYIADTFSGVVNICRSNIDNDFADYPVQDLEFERERFSAEVRMHDETKRQLADSQKTLKESLDLNDQLRKQAEEWEQNAHDAGEMYCDLEQEVKMKNAEIMKLKAELAKMQIDAMSEIEMAILYDRMTGKGV